MGDMGNVTLRLDEGHITGHILYFHCNFMFKIEIVDCKLVQAKGQFNSSNLKLDNKKKKKKKKNQPQIWQQSVLYLSGQTYQK